MNCGERLCFNPKNHLITTTCKIHEVWISSSRFSTHVSQLEFMLLASFSGKRPEWIRRHNEGGWESHFTSGRTCASLNAGRQGCQWTPVSGRVPLFLWWHRRSPSLIVCSLTKSHRRKGKGRAKNPDGGARNIFVQFPKNALFYPFAAVFGFLRCTLVTHHISPKSLV